MKEVRLFESTDGSRWPTEAKAMERDTLDAKVREWEALIPEPPKHSYERVDAGDHFMAVKEAVVALCRELYPTVEVFKHDAKDIHPMSFAGRFLDDTGGPLNRIWHRFMCQHGGFIYEQPYFALNTHKWHEKVELHKRFAASGA